MPKKDSKNQKKHRNKRDFSGSRYLAHGKTIKRTDRSTYGKTFLRICDGCGAGKIKNDQCGPDGTIWPSGYSYYDGTDQTDGQYCQKADAKGQGSNVSGCGRYFKRYCRDPRRLFFCDDIYRVADYVKKQKDITLLKEKDYVKNPKKSGYQSIHLIVGVPVTYLEKTKEIRVEIQIRSFAMDYWAELDNQMCYKKNAGQIENVERATKDYSDVIAKVDNQMLELRRQIEKK